MRTSARRATVTAALLLLAAAVLLPRAAGSESAVGEGTRPGVDGRARSGEARASVSSPDASSRVFSCVFPFDEDTLWLPDRNVFVGSESVVVGGTVLARSEYFLDCENGLVCLKAPLAAGERAEVRYRYLPFYALSSFAAGDAAAVPTAAAPGARPGTLAPARVAAGSLQQSGHGLRLRGTKTFALELGSNRDASLKQSLDMNVSGEITRGLELNAVLTDRDLPIQPEGRTESIQALDEIRVEMRSRAFSASLGDCNLTLDGASLVNVTRKLEGARVTGDLAGTELTAAGSTLRGRWTSREFTGTEGKQGPYQLLSDAGAACVVLAGTERVWLDGARLRRGEGADYWMEYGTGRLYFTNSRAIHAESRIRVEYEYGYGDYQKNFYALRTARSFGGGLARLEFLAASEADDNSLSQSGLGAEEKSILRELGDAPSDGTVHGAAYVGPGRGDYNLVSTDSLGVGVYVYASDGTGSYDVSFLMVGEGKGSYVASVDATGKTFFAYVGPNQAAYVPARALTAPASKRVGDVRTTLSIRGTEVTGEMALSQADMNTLSSKDDADNRGLAGTVAVKTAPVRLAAGSHSLGRLSVTGKMRSIDDHFRTFGNLNTAFDAERWAAQDSSIANRGEKRLELESAYSPFETLSLSLAHGRLESASGLSASRFAYGSELSGPLSVSARLERASSEAGGASGAPVGTGSFRTVGSVGARVNGHRVVPSASYYSEVKRMGVGPGLVVREAGAGLSSGWKGPLTVRIDEKYRVEYDGTPDDRTRRSDALTHTVGVQVTRWGSVSASCEYSLRDLHDYAGTGDRKTELGALSMSQATRSGRVSYELSHRVTSLDAEQSTKSIVYVGQKQGHYDSTGTYRGIGDFEVNITKLDTSILTSDAATSATLTLRPFKGMARRPRGPAESGSGDQLASGLLETLTSSSLFRSTGVLGEAEGVFGLLAGPVYTRRGSALRGSSLIRQELEAGTQSRSAALRYLFEVSNLLNNLYENVRENSEERKNALRLRGEPLKSLTVEAEQTWKTRSRRVEVRGGASADGRLAGTESTLDVKYLPARNVELELYGSLSGLRDEDRGAELRVYRVSPSATYGVRTSTRARVMCTISSYDGDTGVLSTASSAAVVQPYRTELLFSLDHRAGEHLTFSTSVSSRRSTGNFVTDGRLEMRAHF